MEIINTTITRTALETTLNGVFELSYVVNNGALERVHASIRSLREEKSGDKYLGNIIFENGSINSNILYYPDRKVPPLFEDFERFIVDIKESMKNQPAGQE